jgi:Tfp pilus assembly protein PilV
MSLRIADEREQRRGLVLGLTLAEVLLLLLFLLLLALAAKLQQLRYKVEEAN